jgi:hypothetical protein
LQPTRNHDTFYLQRLQRAAEQRRYVSMSRARIIVADQSHGAQFNPAEQLGAFIFIGGFAYGATLLFGVPAFFLFRARRWSNIFLYVFVGGLIGLLVSVILNYPTASAELGLEYRGWWAAAGALSALVFRMLSGATFGHVSRAPANGET